MVNSHLYSLLEQDGFEQWVTELKQQYDVWFSSQHHGDYEKWKQALDLLPLIDIKEVVLSASAVEVKGQCEQADQLEQALTLLRPWRKGPYQLSQCAIDTEWRSDFKWGRVYPHLSQLKDRKVLDVGCGNGYHAWRMLHEAPHLVLGIDPSILFNMQFQALQHYINDPRISMLPMTIQQMPENMQWFDTVFSMGILYHRRSPMDHLIQLKNLLKPGGELCLETLIIEGAAGQVLVPESRYARMNNVWFLPSAEELKHWLKRCGFNNIRVVDVNQTSMDEQRATEWMPFESLKDCLDPSDVNLTVEGYPAPLRAVLIATK